MTAYKDRPGYGLYETLVRDRATGRVRVERRWMKDRVALNLNATPVTAPTWDSTGWLPNGTHRKTGIAAQSRRRAGRVRPGSP